MCQMDPCYPGPMLKLYSAIPLIYIYWVEACTFIYLSLEFSPYLFPSQKSLLMIYESYDSKIYPSPWVPQSHILFKSPAALFFVTTLSIA